jgi:hypothetical protein
LVHLGTIADRIPETGLMVGSSCEQANLPEDPELC